MASKKNGTPKRARSKRPPITSEKWKRWAKALAWTLERYAEHGERVKTAPRVRAALWAYFEGNNEGWHRAWNLAQLAVLAATRSPSWTRVAVLAERYRGDGVRPDPDDIKRATARRARGPAPSEQARAWQVYNVLADGASVSIRPDATKLRGELKALIQAAMRLQKLGQRNRLSLPQ